LKALNIFYSEPEPDRWFKYDRYPRRVVRQLVRGKQLPGGVAMVAINLMKGFDKLKVPYRFNDFRHIRKNQAELACIIGKPHLLFDRKWNNPILFGAGVYSHPAECPDIFEKYPNMKAMLVPGEWMRAMFEPYYKDKVITWPVGIDTDKWSPVIKGAPAFDFLIYDKVRWEHDKFQQELIEPLCKILDNHSLSYHFIKYGTYKPDELVNKLSSSRAAIFLCEHETQGLAYQQMLATGTPVLAWDRGGFWQDPFYYPAVQYGPVSSVPYWDPRCGIKFSDASQFELKLLEFMGNMSFYEPREYIMENLTLEKCAENYLKIYDALSE